MSLNLYNYRLGFAREVFVQPSRLLVDRNRLVISSSGEED
jgi:hypothetical protein